MGKIFHGRVPQMVFPLSRIYKVQQRKCMLLLLLLTSYSFLWIIAAYNNDFLLAFYPSYFVLENKLPQPSFSGKTPQNYLINSSYCKIPDYKAHTLEADILLDKKCKGEFRGPPKCAGNQLQLWNLINASYLHINMTTMKNAGYSWNSIRCCYREIIRVEQELNTSDMNADKFVRYSSNCHAITNPEQKIPPPIQFIRVYCVSTTFPTFGTIISRQFFPVANPDLLAMSKINRWKTASRNSTSPPTFIILGVDSMSRLGSQRYFKETLNVLSSLGAMEMKVYGKTGQTTYSNTVAFLTGYTLSEITDHCYRKLSDPQEECPYVWKLFNKLGYLTTTMDDSPSSTSFNHLKKGFVRKPVDFYIRILMLAVMKYLPRLDTKFIRCLDGRQVEETLLRYLSDILNLAKPTNTPVFAHVWLNGLSHQCTTTAKYSDRLLATYIRNLVKHHENMILVFMGDHGEAFGEFRETLQGWYEDRLPMFWVYVPESITKKFPEWKNSLITNSNRLTSHFDFYKTLVQLLQNFDPANVGWEVYKRLDTQRGQSLFQPVPENRSCRMAGIPDGYCVCSPPFDLELNNRVVKAVVKFAVEHVAKMLPLDVCEYPKLREVKSVKSFGTPDGCVLYLLTFVINPGEYLVEATVKEDLNEGGKLEVMYVMRVNMMKKKMSCTDKPDLDKFCYCK